MMQSGCPHPGTPTPHMAKLPETIEVVKCTSETLGPAAVLYS